MVGRHFDEGDVLYTEPSEHELELLLEKFRDRVTEDMVDVIKEIVEVARKKDKLFGYRLEQYLKGLRK
jgi:translation initiation factor 5B